MPSLSSSHDVPVNWNDLQPLLDRAMDQLKERDRQVMLLRYFKGLSFAEVGGQLMYMGIQLPSATILERAALTPLDNNRYSLAVRGESGTQIQFQRTDSGWSYLNPEAMVDRYIAKTRAKDR
jgi:hypothetical protein